MLNGLAAPRRAMTSVDTAPRAPARALEFSRRMELTLRRRRSKISSKIDLYTGNVKGSVWSCRIFRK
jgi:hypothetical protein